MAVTVELVRNVLTNKYLTHIGNTVSFHNIKNHSNNFHLYDNGPVRHLQVFSNSSIKFSHVPTSNCNQTISTSSTGSVLHTTPNASVGVKLYVKDSTGNKYYLRINTAQNNAVELVCQSYLDSVAFHPYFRQELEFDLITVDSNDL